jgi:predicted HD phosphohydrolase
MTVDQTVDQTRTPTVGFTQMKDGTFEDYQLLQRLEAGYIARLPDRILDALRRLDTSLGGYQVTRLEHSLQTAARAEADGADVEMIVAALVHDLGDELAQDNHSQYAASIIRPYVREEVTWTVLMHGAFQLQYYGHHIGANPNARDPWRGHQWYDTCDRFCERWDQASFDPSYPTPPLAHFEPMVREVFGRRPFDLAVVQERSPDGK